VTAAVLLALIPCAYGAKDLQVANYGADSSTCGPTDSPCRSISKAIANAAPGDTIIVGPGRYGDLNGNGTPGEAGEETPTSGCGCMLAVNKAVVLISSGGAAATMIDARTVDVNTNVLLITNGGEFGRPGHGFTVTNTARPIRSGFDSVGIGIDSNGVSVRGNQVVSSGTSAKDFFDVPQFVPLGTGIDIVDSPGVILIEGNQVVGWIIGILSRGTNKTINQNALQLNQSGISAVGTTIITGNVVAGNFTGNAAVECCGSGIGVSGGGAIVGNAVIGNEVGISVSCPGGVFPCPGVAFSGPVERNNIFGNFACGLAPAVSLLADNNFWGTATGPTVGDFFSVPVHDVCLPSGTAVTATVTPFATNPFNVKAPIEP
jgi:hypothetical protein